MKLAQRILSALNEGALEQAITDLQALQEDGSAKALTLHLVGLVSLRLNEISKAVAAFEEAHRTDPLINEPVEVLAILYAKLGRLSDGLYYGKLSIAAQNRFPVPGMIPEWLGSFEESFFNMQERPLLAQAERALQTGHYLEAIRSFRQAAEIEPNAPETWRGLATAHRLAGQPFESVEALRRIEAITTPEAGDYAALGETLELLGRWEEAIECHDQATALAPTELRFRWAAVRCRLRQPASESALQSAANAWADHARQDPIFDTPPWPDTAGLERRALRLGVYTANWLDPAGLALMLPLLLALPKDRVELSVYSDGPADTDLARRLRGHAKRWENFTDIDDETAAFTLGNEELDVLIDLDGPLRRTRRPSLFQYGPHPITLSLLDLPIMAKAAGYARALTDAPTGLAEPLELGIPGIATNLPSDLALLVTPIANRPLDERTIVFGTLAPYGRIGMTETVLWADLLAQVPGSVLAVEPDRLGGDRGVAEILDRFARVGLAERVRLEPQGQSPTDYLERVDLLLDAPGSPLYEEAVVALAAGVPIITTAGGSPAAKVLANWLRLLGLDELVAHDGQSYVEKARMAVTAPAGPKLRERLSDAIDRERKTGATTRARLFDAALRELVLRTKQA